MPGEVIVGIGYHPLVMEQGRVAEAAGPIDRFLILGDEVHEVALSATSVGLIEFPSVRLPRGVYTFAHSDAVDVMVVDIGDTPASAIQADWSVDDAHPLRAAYSWFESLWSNRAPVAAPRFTTGELVVLQGSGQEALVRGRSFEGGTWLYDVRYDGATRRTAETALDFPDLDDDPSSWIRQAPEPAERFAATLTRAKIAEQLSDTVYSFKATRTLFRPYQFRPLIRILRSPQMRLLIADEVGLGKTIEAGLIWTELDSRDLARRVLIVCPSSLVEKWKREMYTRFGFELDELTPESLKDLMDKAESDRLPTRHAWICSVTRLSRWKHLEEFAELSPRFDLIIADEAHMFRNRTSKTNALGQLLSDWADALIFLSATPLNLGNDDLFNLLELLSPGEFQDRTTLEQQLRPNALLNRVGRSLLDRSATPADREAWLRQATELPFGAPLLKRPEFVALRELVQRATLDPAAVVEARRLLAELHALSAVITRTRKVEVDDQKALREAWEVPVILTPEEATLYRAIEKWQYQKAIADGVPGGFATQMPRRLAGSSLQAAKASVLARSGFGAYEESSIESEKSDIAPVPDEVIAAAKMLGDVDSKYDAFLEKLHEVLKLGRRVIVFTFSRKALEYLATRLTRDGIRIGQLHGGIKNRDRDPVMASFRAHNFDVLLATRVASEGLDFEFASVVVNWDLPWNPMEVEQRIGRIDRIGQAEDKLIILNFHTPGTIETDIVLRLYKRIGLFEDAVGELDPILRSSMAELERLDASLSPEQLEAKIDAAFAAHEDQKRSAHELEEAAPLLATTDQAEIDGLEQDLVSSGRYVGQRELVALLQDWIAGAPGARLTTTADDRWAVLRGTAALEDQLWSLKSAGERSQSELQRHAADLRYEADIRLCLDQDTAREVGADMLSASHPLVRAALRVPGGSQARFSLVRASSPDVPPGDYLVLTTVARWTGIRHSSELWTFAIEPTGATASDEVGNLLLSTLAAGDLRQSHLSAADVGGWTEHALSRALRMWNRRQMSEQARRSDENASLLQTRMLSLQTTHERKAEQISEMIRNLEREGKSQGANLNRARLRRLGETQRQAENKLREQAHGELHSEPLAVCILTVEPSLPVQHDDVEVLRG